MVLNARTNLPCHHEDALFKRGDVSILVVPLLGFKGRMESREREGLSIMSANGPDSPYCPPPNSIEVKASFRGQESSNPLCSCGLVRAGSKSRGITALQPPTKSNC